MIPDDLVYLFIYLRFALPPDECGAGTDVGEGIGGFEFEDFRLPLYDFISGCFRGGAGFGHRGTPDQFTLTLNAIIQHKPSGTVLDCGANPEGNTF